MAGMEVNKLNQHVKKSGQRCPQKCGKKWFIRRMKRSAVRYLFWWVYAYFLLEKGLINAVRVKVLASFFTKATDSLLARCHW